MTLVCQTSGAQAQAPAPAPGSVLESNGAAAAAYPISAQEAQPLTSSASLSVTCNITFIGLSASSTPAVATAGRRLQAATNTSLGLSTADIQCTGSNHLTIVGGPAVEAFASSWTGENGVLEAADGRCYSMRGLYPHERRAQEFQRISRRTPRLWQLTAFYFELLFLRCELPA